MSKKMNFEDLINSDRPTLIDFSAEWCGPCKAMAPILKEVAGLVGNEAKIVKIDVDKNRVLANNLSIRGVPTFILFKNGKALWRQSGMQSTRTLTEIIHKYSDVKSDIDN
ncbi:MAG: thioredoxin [Saprospiraceae bacterium]|nr:thioredoxin [Saprospiraceae bacterium]